MHRKRGPGYATVGEVAAHWRVTRETANRILHERRASTIRRRGRRYVAWRDVWLVEGAARVTEDVFSDYREPLFTTSDVAERYGVSERTARRWMEDGDVPAIRLGERILRVRPRDLDAQDEALEEGAYGSGDEETTSGVMGAA